MASPNLADDPSTPDIDESDILKIDPSVAPTYGIVMPTVATNQRVPSIRLDTYTGAPPVYLDDSKPIFLANLL
jgi:hypothetical protein